MKYLLDTDHLVFLQRRAGAEYAALSTRMARHSYADFALSVVSIHEQILGAHGLINQAKTTRQIVQGYVILQTILQDSTVAQILAFDTAAGAIFDTLRAQRIRIATMDLRIAATALSHNLIVLTRNSKDFSRVPGLTIEDWTI